MTRGGASRLAAVVFLADPRSAFVTGHSLLVDGGYTAQ
jgi:NAD(P)-dependent dehydrogenase (short-subunit alcohol dehydrogenase family)